MIQSLTIAELRDMLENGDPCQLIDVREPVEHESYNIGGQLIPFGEILDRSEELDKEIPVVLYCEKGIRSMIAIQRLQQKFSMQNLYNLSGGMQAWRNFFGQDI